MGNAQGLGTQGGSLEACQAIDLLNEVFAKYDAPQIINTDQGCQFAAHDFVQTVKDNGCQVSMDGRGAWRDKCGSRVYPLSSLVPLVKQYNMFPRMSFETELLVRADWERIPIINVPTRVHYPENGVSHFLSIKDNVYISLMHTKMFFCMLPRAPQLLYQFFTDPKK